MWLRRSLLIVFLLCFSHVGLAVNPLLADIEEAISMAQGPRFPSRPPIDKKSVRIVVQQEGCPDLNLSLQTYFQMGPYTLSSAPVEVALGQFFATFSDSKFTKACQYPIDLSYVMVVRFIKKNTSQMSEAHVDKDIYGRITGNFSTSSTADTIASIGLTISPETKAVAVSLPSWDSQAHFLVDVDSSITPANFVFIPNVSPAYFYADLNVFLD